MRRCQWRVSARRSRVGCQTCRDCMGTLLKVSAKLYQCTDGSKKLFDLIWGTQTSLWTPHTRNVDRDCAREYKTEWQGKISRNLLASQLCSAMPPLESVKVFVSIMMSVGWSSKCNPFKLIQYDLSRAYFQRTAQRLKCVSVFQRKVDRNMARAKLAD